MPQVIKKTNSKVSKANTHAWTEFGISSLCCYKPLPATPRNVEYKAGKVERTDTQRVTKLSTTCERGRDPICQDSEEGWEER